MIDFERIKIFYKLGRDLTFSDVQVLLKSARTKVYLPGENLIQEGGMKREVFLIQKGLIRAYKINNRGEEITTLVRWENKIVASPDIILFNEPSQFYFEALEPTKVYCIDYDVLQGIITKNPKLEANRKFILLSIMKELARRVNSFMLQSPEERYVSFVDENTDIINRVPNKYIANILGITPVSLSRIRKRIASKKNR